jgi:hypothetical protein
MGWQTVAGTTLAVCVAAPATYDAAGYGALAWTAVGEITNIGGDLGKDFQTAEHAPIAQSQILQRKANYRLGQVDLDLAWDQADAGQDILRAAGDDPDDIISVKITKQNGDFRYFTAQVLKFVERFGAGGDVNKGMCSLLRQRDVVMSPA